jgi:hypothetical protein
MGDPKVSARFTKKKVWIIGLFLILILQGLGVGGAGAEDEESCESCHSVLKPDGEYILQEPVFWVDAPGRVSPNETFKVIVVITHYGLYDIKALKMELDLSKVSKIEFGTGESGLKNIAKIGSKAQTQRLNWVLKTGFVTGDVNFPIYINYTLEHVHTTVEEADNYDYQPMLTHQLEIKETPISLSTWKIRADLGESETHYIEITAKKNIYNLKVDPGRNLRPFTDVKPSVVGTLAQGAFRNVTVTLHPTHEMEHGRIVISWTTDQEGYDHDSLDVEVSISEKVEARTSSSKSGAGTWLWGRVTGFIGLSLLIVLIPTGGTFRGLSRRFDKVIGTARKRVDLHCALSYQMFALGLLHVTLLMYGRYSSLVWNGIFLLAEPESPYINLGFVAVLLLIIISLFGIFQKQLVKKTGHKWWTRIHGWLTFSTIGVVVAHLLLVGTTIGLPLRTAF